MTLDQLKKLEEAAFVKMRERYRNLTSGDLQTVAVAFEFLNAEFEQPDPVCCCGRTSEGLCPRCGQNMG